MHLQSTTIRLTGTQEREVISAFDNYGNYRNKLMGIVRLTRAENGLPLDSAWQELSDAFPDLFPPDTNEGDMPNVLYKTVETIRRQIKTGKASIKYSFKEYGEKQKQNWSNSKRIIIYEDNAQLDQFIDDAIQHKNLGKKMYFGVIPTDLAARIKEETGINVDGYNCTLHADEILKILKVHGDEKSERLRGQRAITKSDFSLIPDVIQSPDKIVLSPKKYNGKPVLLFSKKISGKITVTAYVSDRRLDLSVQTMYASKKNENLATPADDQASANTPGASRGTVLNPNVSHPDTSVKGNVHEDSEGGKLTPSQAEYFKDSKDIRYMRGISSNRVNPAVPKASGDTSINKAQLPVVFKRVKFEPGTVNLDLGGGKYDNATEYLASQGVTNYIYDPYNRDAAHNAKAAAATQDGQADTVTISNVLNVIKEQDARDQVLANAVDAVKPDGTVYITIYEGNGTGRGKETPKGWQENRTTNSYLKEVRKFFGDVAVKNRVIIAKGPKKSMVLNAYGDSASVQKWTAERVGLAKKTMPISDIINMIRHDFNIPVTTGHIRGRKILGQYNTQAQGIRSKIANDLPTVAHELGHQAWW